MRTILALAAVLVVSTVPVTAGAQHGATDAPAAHAAAAPKPAAKSEAPATHDAKTASEKKPSESGKPAAAVKKTAPKTELEAAFERIAQKIEGVEVMKGGLRVSSPSPQGRPVESHAVDAHKTEPRAARADAPPRIRLNWRSSVVWPAMPGPVEADDSAPTHETSRIILAWP